MPRLIMKIVPLLVVVIALAGTARAEARSIYLHATHHVGTWRSEVRFSPHAVLSDEVVVEGHSLPTTTVEGCRATWAGRGVAVTANTCGRGAMPIRLRFVALGQPKDFRFSYKRLRRFTEP